MSHFPHVRRVLTLVLAVVLAALALLAPLAGLAPAEAATRTAASRTATDHTATDRTATSRTAVLADCEHRSVEPRRVFIACGDGALFLQVRSYRSWNAREAVGRGAIW
ncbi:MAG: hypothetical protein JOZ82_03170, partial [Marmoricola sp.]|nr:hypothetical protein [Marmoricola sp.]